MGKHTDGPALYAGRRESHSVRELYGVAADECHNTRDTACGMGLARASAVCGACHNPVPSSSIDCQARVMLLLRRISRRGYGTGNFINPRSASDTET